MKMANNYVSILVYLWQSSYESLHFSYIGHDMLATLYYVMIHIYRVNNGSYKLNTDESYVSVLVSEILLIFNESMIQFQMTPIISFYEWVYNLSIYSEF